ncbi:MAG: type II toxin-antitoxin system RelE/ParE family toxin [Thiobacillus sp.]
MKIRLHPAAEQDVAEAAAYYEQAGSAILAARFIAEFKHLTGLVIERPHIGVPRARGRRGIGMRHFPYTVIYRVDMDEIMVMVVKHDSKHPGFGGKRSRKGWRP